MAAVSSNIFELTAKYFNAINYDEISSEYTNHLFCKKFKDIEDIPMAINILFVHDAAETLRNLAEVTELWIKKLTEVEIKKETETSPQHQSLWSYLESLYISTRKIMAMIYLVVSKALRSTSSLVEKEIGLGGAKFYFASLRVPGSTAYSFFDQTLYRCCIDCFQIPDLAPESRETPLYGWKEFEKLLPGVVATLNSLLPLFDTFHLGSQDGMLNYTINKVVDLTGCELNSADLNFDEDYLNIEKKDPSRHYKLSLLASSLAYQGLLSLIRSNLGGDKSDENYSLVVDILSKHILFINAKDPADITTSFHIIKQNAISFIKYNLTKDKGLYSKETFCFLKRLCLRAENQATYRAGASEAILLIMPYLRVEHSAEMVKWLLDLSDSEESSHRVLAFDILGGLFSIFRQIDDTKLCTSLKVYLTKSPIIFAILTRCDDISVVVRSRALTVLSDHIKMILDFFSEFKECLNFPREEFDAEIMTDKGFNGENRVFWYNIKTYRILLNEIASVLYRGTEDNNLYSRKAALLSLAILLIFDVTYLCEDNLKRFEFASKDQAAVIRKQVVHSLTAVLDTYTTNCDAQKYWITCILPLTLDSEITVQVIALGVLEDQFLHKIVSSSASERDCVFSFLKMLIGELISHQGFLKKAFNMWKSENKLKPQLVTQLEKIFGDCRDGCFWFYVSLFASYSKLPPSTCNFAVEDFKKHQSSWSSTSMKHILNVLGCIFDTLPPEKVEIIKSMLQERLKCCNIPVALLPKAVEVLYRIHQHLKSMDEFSQFCEKIIKTAMSYLSPFVLHKNLKSTPSENLVIRCMSLVKEICLIFPGNLTQDVTRVFKSFVSDPPSGSASNIKRITPTLQAHAFAALGKMSLQDATLAKELLPILATKLVTAKEGVIRNNCSLIMLEMCKIYNGYADEYLPLITTCFKDELFINRYQTGLLFMNLLQGGYIKCKGHLFFCLVSTVIDKNEAMQDLGEFVLCEILLKQNASIFDEHFVNSIFVFNHYAPPGNETLTQMIKKLDRFALIGECRKEKRLHIYKFMLEYTSIAYRYRLASELCKKILSVAGTVLPLNSVIECMVRDCFAIITSKEIRVCHVNQFPENLGQEQMLEIAHVEYMGRKLGILKPVIPVILSLKNRVMDVKFELLKDIIVFLKDILRGFKVPDFLGTDIILQRQVEREMLNEDMRWEREAKEKQRKANETNKKPPKPVRLRGQDIVKKAMEITQSIIEDERKNLGTPGSKAVLDPETGHLLLYPRTPRRRRKSRKPTTERQSISEVSKEANKKDNKPSQETSPAASGARTKQPREQFVSTPLPSHEIHSETGHLLLYPRTPRRKRNSGKPTTKRQSISEVSKEANENDNKPSNETSPAASGARKKQHKEQFVSTTLPSQETNQSVSGARPKQHRKKLASTPLPSHKTNQSASGAKSKQHRQQFVSTPLPSQETNQSTSGARPKQQKKQLASIPLPSHETSHAALGARKKRCRKQYARKSKVILTTPQSLPLNVSNISVIDANIDEDSPNREG